MLKLWDLDDNFERKIDKMKNMMELRIFMEPLLLKGQQRDSPTNHKLFWNVKMKNGVLGNKAK